MVVFSRSIVRLAEKKYRVGVLGASGAVGSRFCHMLQDHPWFDVVALGGAPNEEGKPYGEVAYTNFNFLNPNGVPSPMSEQKIISGDNPKLWADKNVNLVFSAIPDEFALKAEKDFADYGIPVFSNSPVYRMHPQVPLLQPYINPEHLHLAKVQDSYKNSGGFIATNPNCSTITMTIGLKPIFDSFGIGNVLATTLQSTSGSGYPGLPFADMWDNCVPYIGNEEDKIEEEGAKILGKFNESNGVIDHASCKVSATANRVPTSDGHMICVSIKLAKDNVPIDEVREVIKNYVPSPAVDGLPSCPKKPIRYFDNDLEPKRPQHRLDRLYEGGMGVNVGRVRECKVNDIKYTILGHNTIIGAAGGSILNAELACREGLIKSS